MLRNLFDYNILKYWPGGETLLNFGSRYDSSKLRIQDLTNVKYGNAPWKKILVKLRTDKGVHNEVVRHRPCSFMAESQRYVRYGLSDEPLEVCISSKDLTDTKYSDIITVIAESSFIAYKQLLSEGYSPQKARAVLPVGTAMTYFVYATIEEWHHIFRLRTASAALPLMQETMKAVRTEMINKRLI